jgi:acetyl esterase
MHARLATLFAVTIGLALSARGAGPPPPATAPVITPASIDGAETFVYREGKPDPMRLHVFKPAGWSAEQRRPAMVYFFGGGFVRGTPEKSAGWARMAAKWGMVGVAPDYRTIERFGTTAAECVADARAAVRWVQDHADELGIDPRRVVVGGNSAGGHLALWTAIAAPPPGSDPSDSPTHPPAALVLVSALSDTSTGPYARRIGARARELSPVHHLDARMPPTLLFHGDADTVVPHAQAVALRRRLADSGNAADLVTVPGGTHGFATDQPAWKEKSRETIRAFLVAQKLVED